MVNSEWLDLAIGVVMMWFLFALAVSAINEAVVKVLALRSKQLWAALSQMLDGGRSPAGLLRSVVTLPMWPRPASPTPAANAPVSARLYATQTVQALEIRSAPTQKTRIENLPASVFSHAILELAQGAGNIGAAPAGGPPGGGVVDQADAAYQQVVGYVDGLPPGRSKSQLEAVLTGASRDVTAFRDGVEKWFDGQMSRVSRLYRAQVHVVLILIGLIVAFAGFALGLQSNSLQLVSELQHDQNLRSVVVGAASASAQGNLEKSSGCDAAALQNDPVTCQLKGLSSLDNLDFALRGVRPPPGVSVGERLGFLLPWRHFYAFLGVVLTAIAISFGSSFWFSVLKRLVGLRSSTDAKPS